jgi:eukaryotic-like serine/threonine-protein kinase
MVANRHCSRCGRDFRPTALEGLCPDCLAQLAFGPAVAAETEPGADLSTSPSVAYFGDYALLAEIARGGSGVVYKAKQRSLNRLVAVKMLLFGHLAREDVVRRFKAEAEAAALLQHPNIIRIHEVGEHEGQYYFSMDFVEGQSLAERARDNPLPPELAADYLRTIAETVHYAHQRGILHRDLKPSNILIDPLDQPRITDFGLAKRLDIDEDLTRTGQVMGTPHYMSPEQARGRRGEVTVASDVYGLGAVLYHLLTGQPPFLAESLEGVFDQVLHREPLRPGLLSPRVPRDLETVCLKCLEKDPRRRYPSAQELADDLARFAHGEPVHALPVTTVQRLRRWCRRKPALAASIAALHLVAAAGLAGILWQWGRAQQHATEETAQRRRAEGAVTLLELQRAEDLLEKDESVMGVAYLARILRQRPTNPIAAQRLLSALTQRDFVLPVGAPLQHGKKVNYTEFSPDGRRVVTASLDSTARVWDARTGQPAGGPMLHSNAVRYAHFSPDGQCLVTVADAPAALLWDTATGRPIGHPMRHDERVRFAQFSPDGRLLVTASDDRTARFWNAHTGEPRLSPLRHAAPVRWVWFSPDGRWIVTLPTDGTASVWDAASGQAAGKPLVHGAVVNTAGFSPDSRWVVTASDDGTARVWEVATGEPVTEPLQHHSHVNWAEFSPDGQRIATASLDGMARVWEARTGKPLAAPLAHGGWLATAQFSPDGRRLLTGFPDNAARLRDARTGRMLAAPFQHDGVVWSARFSPDGQFLVTASADKTARIWDLRPGRPLNIPLVHADQVHSVGFSPDAEWVITASEDRTARVWDALTGRAVTEPLRHLGSVSLARFSPDGRRVITASADGTARLWDARTGRPLAEPFRHESDVWVACFSRDGQRVATASRDGTARVWELPPAVSLIRPRGSRREEAHSLRAIDQGVLTSAATTRSEDSAAAILLADLAEAVIGQRLGDSGSLEPTPPNLLVDVRQQLSRQPPTNALTRWLAWFLADRSTRTISPNSPVTIPEYVARCLEERSLAAASEAVLLAPNHAPALAHLAEMLLASPGSNAPDVTAEAEYLIRRAESLAPDNPDVQASAQRAEQRLAR